MRKLTTTLLILFFAIPFHDQLTTNLENLGYLNTINKNNLQSQQSYLLRNCQQIWLAVSIANGLSTSLNIGDINKILLCEGRYVTLLKTMFPTNRQLAESAVKQYPDNAEAWFWLGEASNPIDPIYSRIAYLHSTLLNSTYGLAWCRLGWNYENNGEKQQAKTAFFNCCIHGDPGSNGCYGAGRMAEKLGDPQKAIEYYRLSRWEGSLDRADELEAELNSGN